MLIYKHNIKRLTTDKDLKLVKNFIIEQSKNYLFSKNIKHETTTSHTLERDLLRE